MSFILRFQAQRSSTLGSLQQMSQKLSVRSVWDGLELDVLGFSVAILNPQ